MSLHLKSSKSFKILIGFSALLISVMAATFSITGIATLFSGYFLTVALMMGALEFAKIIVASFLARYWNNVSRILRGYFIAALFILILITSGGIFGYLSDAYQQTKGDYTIVENQTDILKNKKNRYDLNIQDYRTEKERVDDNINVTLQALRDNKITYRDTSGTLITTQSSTARRLYQRQLDAEQLRRTELTTKIDALTDSSTAIDMKIFELESKNIQGELGPLRYIAGIFNTDMDTVVKYFIFFLIFVFDPLAVLLFVALNMIIRKEGGMYEEDGDDDTHGPFDEPDNNVEIKEPTITVDAETVTQKLKDGIKDILDKKEDVEDIPEETVKTMDVVIENFKVGKVSEPIDLDKFDLVQNDGSENFVEQMIEDFEHTVEEEKLDDEWSGDGIGNVDSDAVIEVEEEKKEEHEFYHGEEEKKEEKKPPMIITKKSANYHPPLN